MIASKKTTVICKTCGLEGTTRSSKGSAVEWARENGWAYSNGIGGGFLCPKHRKRARRKYNTTAPGQRASYLMPPPPPEQPSSASTGTFSPPMALCDSCKTIIKAIKEGSRLPQFLAGLLEQVSEGHVSSITVDLPDGLRVIVEELSDDSR